MRKRITVLALVTVLFAVLGLQAAAAADVHEGTYVLNNPYGKPWVEGSENYTEECEDASVDNCRRVPEGKNLMVQLPGVADEREVSVLVTYLDKGNAKMRLNYRTEGNVYYWDLAPFQTGNTNTWKTHAFHLKKDEANEVPAPKFDQSTSMGDDVRIKALEGEVYISSVSVVKGAWEDETESAEEPVQTEEPAQSEENEQAEEQEEAAEQPSEPADTEEADDIIVTLNGETLTFDQAPVLLNNRVMVPLRGIFEAVGASVSWDQATQTAEAQKDGTTVTLTINQTTAFINDNPVTLDQPAEVVNARTLVPLRFIGEAIGANVIWHGESRTVEITLNEQAQ